MGAGDHGDCPHDHHDTRRPAPTGTDAFATTCAGMLAVTVGGLALLRQGDEQDAATSTEFIQSERNGLPNDAR